MESTLDEAALALLPDDVLAAVLGLLPPRSLAASRCVCRSWRAVVDDRRLLLPHVLPHSLRGLFINYQDYGDTHYLARPTPSSSAADDDGPPRRIDGRFDFIVPEQEERGWHWHEVVDHCNGLVLRRNKNTFAMYVCNPATRRWVRLPDIGTQPRWTGRAFLVFDPTVSKHYTVLLPQDDRAAPPPPSPWAWHEFSSRRGRWKEKVFVREGEPAAEGRRVDCDSLGYSVEPRWRYAAYWQGSLYVHCHGEFVSRLSLSSDKYQVIKSPIELTEYKHQGVRTFLGRSRDGIYFAAIGNLDFRAKLRVWTLRESIDHQTEWVPKHQSNLTINYWRLEELKHQGRPWILDARGNKNQKVSPVEQDVCWNSDDDDDNSIDDVADDVEESYFCNFVKFLGFHPYKEVVFLGTDHDAVACHLNSSKVRHLGTIGPGTYNRGV